jgi:outer membrane protein TolC
MPLFQKTAPFVISCVFASAAYAQAPGAPAATASQTGIEVSASSSANSATPQIPSSLQEFQASVPQGTASATPIPLTLGDAITRGLRANLGLLTNEQSSREIRAQRIRALSALLPKVTGQANAVEQQINLQTVGISFPGVPKVIGPFGYQSVQANADVTFFDWSAFSQYRSAREQTKAAALDVKNARDLVVLSVGYAYLQIISDAARISATQAEIDADNAVYTNALRRHNAGTAIGLDVLRSQVELKQRQQQLVAVTNQFAKDKLTLGRVIGLPVGQDFTVADPSPSVPLATLSLQEALQQAYEHRPDYRAAKARVLAAELMLRAAKAERYPTLTANGYYGDAGLHLFTNSHGVFNVTGSLRFNIFDGGRIKADILQQDAELHNRRNELENLRGQIDFDVRGALLDLNSAKAQLDVAQSNLQLASETVKQSRDRFAAGVTNTVEVVQAQQSLADANENLISAQYQYNVAKVSLARALGLAEQAVATYFARQP